MVGALLRLAPYLRFVGNLEDELFAERLADIPIERPVFVTGLARAGAALLLRMLAQAPGVATHRGRDFPFLYAPLAWNRLQDLTGVAGGEGPEAYEEPLWQAHFPWAHDPARCHAIGKDTSHPEFEAAFALHLRKILWLRGGRRYVSKGNYNVARIAYIARLFPDARFVIPVRDPVSHVHALVKQHELFTKHAAQDARLPRYLAAAGHYEFGPQRRPLHLETKDIGSIEAARRAGDEYRGYARQWAQVYGHVERLRRDPWLSARILAVRYEDACAAPQVLRRDLLKSLVLSDPMGRVNAVAATFAVPEKAEIAKKSEKTVWEETASVAAKFGYHQPSPGIARAA